MRALRDICLRAVVLAATIVAAGCGRLGFELLDVNPVDGGDPDAGRLDGGLDGEVSKPSEESPSGDAAAGPHAEGDAGGDGSAADAASSANCGNAAVEAGEECDDGAASATCDPDCTFASCGDGVTNALAGEACDDGDRLASCTATCHLPECRAGCTCEWYGGVRYMFCAEQLTEVQARAACEDLGMRLVRIGTGTEHTFLRQRTLQDGYGKFHLGATDEASEGTWVWNDGTAFWMGVANGAPINGEFTAWAPGEPNAFVAGENCSEVQSMQGWNDCTCDQVKPFVCKEQRDPLAVCGDGVVGPGEACDGSSVLCDDDCSPAICGDGVANAAAGEQCDDAATQQYCQPDCTARVCPAGCSCLQVAGRSFAVCPSAKTFGEAGVACGRAGMTLARVQSSTVDQALRGAATGAGIGEYWIGVFDIDQADRWLRSDLSPAWNGTATGTAQGYANFTTGAPSGASNQDCLAVLPTGKWQDRSCTVQKPYACEQL
ncbi:MAG: C-type lectin domain-containing protein [Myxococcales bacterium]